MTPRIDIKNDTISLHGAAGEQIASVSLAAFVDTLARQVEQRSFPGLLVDGIRLVRQRGQAISVCLELPPQVRTVRWLARLSPAAYGPKARYQQVRLAFPYIVLIVAFWNGTLTGQQQLFYRRTPLTSEDDPLCLPNLYNVAEGYGQQCWLCLQNLGNLAGVPWSAKLQRIIEHLFTAFNRSSEVHEGNSYWGKMRHLDRRIRSVAAWQRHSQKDPLFVLSVPWEPAQVTVRQVMDAQLARITRTRPITTDVDLVTLLLRTTLAQKR